MTILRNEVDEFKDKRFFGILEQIDTYLKSVGKRIKIIISDVPDSVIKVLESFKEGKQDIENYVVVRSFENGDDRLWWVFYDVEFVFDDRPSGKVGSTGSIENIMNAMRKLGGVMIPRV